MRPVEEFRLLLCIWWGKYLLCQASSSSLSLSLSFSFSLHLTIPRRPISLVRHSACCCFSPLQLARPHSDLLTKASDLSVTKSLARLTSLECWVFPH
ncbi:hypothetical protein F5X96DRAFT_137065 [Biscogniauxia mediterranea]|nr:hypothetical protein F5X96DRAFT_137065 [Biscogniauxia mediterranea]